MKTWFLHSIFLTVLALGTNDVNAALNASFNTPGESPHSSNEFTLPNFSSSTASFKMLRNHHHKGKYSNVQFLGFNIYTGPDRTCEDTSEDCYLGVDDEEQDILNRLEIMKDAVNNAYTKSDTNIKTLKIFVAPEFYWRGRKGAYDLEQEHYFYSTKSQMNEKPLEFVTTQLEELVKDKMYENWLFVFGTFVGSEYQGEDMYKYMNVGLMYKGGKRIKKYLVPKFFISTIDFLKREESLYPDDIVHYPITSFYDSYSKEYLHKHKFKVITDAWFRIDGITMTIEICLDHYYAVAQSNENDHLAQISLITSGGMMILEDNLSLEDNGFVFIQDGLNNIQYFGTSVLEQRLEDGNMDTLTLSLDWLYSYQDTVDTLENAYSIESYHPHIIYSEVYEIPPSTNKGGSHGHHHSASFIMANAYIPFIFIFIALRMKKKHDDDVSLLDDDNSDITSVKSIEVVDTNYCNMESTTTTSATSVELQGY